MKDIILDGRISNYCITEKGEIYNKKTQKWLQGSITVSGYRYYRFSQGGKKYRFYAHILVAIYYLESSYEKSLVVNHKDGNKLNNYYKNLEYITQSENVVHAHKNQLISRKRAKADQSSLMNEEWVVCKENEQYMVSNLGRVKSCKYGKERIVRPSLSNGYYKVTFSSQNKQMSYLVAYLVFFNFYNLEQQKGFVINHIDGNKINNALSNLEYIDVSQNVRNAYYQQKLNPAIRAVICYKDEQFVGKFPSIAVASRELDLDPSSISKVCRGIYRHTHNYTFKYFKEGSTTIGNEQTSSEVKKVNKLDEIVSSLQ